MRLSVAVLLLAGALGCTRARDGDRDVGSTAPADSWVRIPPDEFFNSHDRRDLAKDEFAVVTVDEAKALAKLEDSSWVKLTPQEAEQFLGRPFPELIGQLVLLRALSLNELNGAYSVALRLDSVRVHHGSLGDHPVPIKRRALVVRLPYLPSDVYVNCGMAK